MDNTYTLTLENSKATLEVAGGKGASLARMARTDLPVPGGFHITTAAYRQFVTQNDLAPQISQALETVDPADTLALEAASQVIKDAFCNAPIPEQVASDIVATYNNLPGNAPAVAVRSSATAEDLPEASFAGQQETYLNVIGSDALLEAVRKCWASLWTARAIGYRSMQGIDAGGVALAVVVQLLIPAEAAGILFTANPLNGRRDQALINVSWGLGEAVVGGLVTPDSLTLDKATGQILSQEIAEKLVQTVRVDGGAAEGPVPENLRRAPVLNEEQAAELVSIGNRIETLFGGPMDIEWALANGVFSILQARPITALIGAEPPTPSEWKLPKGAYAAMRNNIVELMADPLTPLFSTLGLEAVNTSFGDLLSGFLGRADIMPGELIINVNEYAYYNGSIKFGPMMSIFLHARSIMKRMFTGAVERWTEDGRPKYIATVEHWKKQDWRQLPASEILAAVRELTIAAIDAYGSLVGGIIPAAWISEGLFTLAYKFVKRRDDPTAPTYLMGYDSLPIQAEKSLYDLATWARENPALSTYLKKTQVDQLVSLLGERDTPQGVSADEWDTWKRHFQAHLNRYGHTIYNLDFGSPTPADDPAPVMQTFKLFLSGQGVNPHERQASTAQRREDATMAIRNRFKGFRLNLFSKNLARAQKYAPLREDGLADVGLSYPLLRQMLFELGNRLASNGMIQDAGDIFWLRQVEVERAVAKLDQGKALEDLTTLIPERKATWRAARRAAPPLMLPQIRIFGVYLGELKSGSRKFKGDSLKGVAASPGKATAPACVIHGPEDFAKMKAGDVLVAPLTTPAWTPLFARAAAIVTDVGGPLSHGSIVAREYGIPAVLGTGAATKRFRSGQILTVDGSAGVVYLEK